MTTNKRGGYRENSGAKPKPPAEVASVRIVANVTEVEAQEWKRRGRTAWLRAELRNDSTALEAATDKADFFKQLLLAVLEKTGAVRVSTDFEALPYSSKRLWISESESTEGDIFVGCGKLAVPDTQ